MKNITPSLVLFLGMLTCFSCNKSKVEVIDDALRLDLFELKPRNDGFIGANVTSVLAEYIIATLDVKSYNARTGEIVFNNKLPEQIGEWKDNGYKVRVYDADKLLFTLTFVNSKFSYLYNEPVLYYSLIDQQSGNTAATRKHKCYILSGYPYGNLLDIKKIQDSVQRRNFEGISANWNQFIATLKKSGKYRN